MSASFHPAHLSTIFSSMGEGLLVVDADSNITHSNPQACRLLGRKPEELVGKDIRNVISIWNGPEKLLGNVYPITKVLKSKTAQSVSVEDNVSFAPEHAPVFPVAFTMAPLMLDARVSGVVLVFKDVGEARKLREARTNFISIASHQLRTPLTPIRWFAQLLLNGVAGDLNTEQRDFVRYIYENNDRMIQLLNTLLQMARIEEGRVKVDPKPTDLVELAKKVVVSLTPLAQSRNILITVLDARPTLPMVPVDQVIMWQVLQNLLTNAIRYSYDGKPVTLGFAHKGNYLEGYVKDEGIGIPNALAQKIYQRFFRSSGAVKKAPEGSGLGLALVKTLVEGWGGAIWHESVEGKGSTFYFTLPLSGMKARPGEVTLEV